MGDKKARGGKKSAGKKKKGSKVGWEYTVESKFANILRDKPKQKKNPFHLLRQYICKSKVINSICYRCFGLIPSRSWLANLLALLSMIAFTNFRGNTLDIIHHVNLRRPVVSTGTPSPSLPNIQDPVLVLM